MRKLSLLMHTSLDGFVGGPKGEMDWIYVDEEIFDVAGALTDDSDLALYGRNTFNMMEGHWPTAADKPNASRHTKHHSKWYNSVKKVVFSHTMKKNERDDVIVLSENIPEQIKTIKQDDGKGILAIGSPTAVHTLMENDLIDDYWLFVNPVLLGNGIPLFTDIHDRRKLKLVSSTVYKSGVVCLHYTV
jgi:dihydrofolate reductase